MLTLLLGGVVATILGAAGPSRDRGDRSLGVGPCLSGALLGAVEAAIGLVGFASAS